MLPLVYSALLLIVLAYFVVLPASRPLPPPTPDNRDDGGEPLDDDLPDLDLPPGISRPISDFEPDYHQPRRPSRPLRIG
ncbi:MAG: hypothetical protein H7330_03395 [Hymenobacteraceae bacterium]|nr:hypothetical protein [Hymenobacteraceae bacterium]